MLRAYAAEAVCVPSSENLSEEGARNRAQAHDLRSWFPVAHLDPVGDGTQ
jgi:hypothetical protein